jgi:hypothetical protein
MKKLGILELGSALGFQHFQRNVSCFCSAPSSDI